MDIIVCIKLVPSVTDVYMDQQHTLVREGVVQIINPADESAFELAMRLKGNGSVTVVTMGKTSYEGTLRALLARGADKAVLVSDLDFAGSDTYATAKTLAATIKHLGRYNLILCGRRAIDGETGQVPSELATLLNIPFVTNVVKMNNSDQKLNCSRLLEDGTEELSLCLPAVISICEYSYPIRLASIIGIKRAKLAEVTLINREMLGLEKNACGLKGSPTQVKSVTSQQIGVRNVILIKDVREGVEQLNKLIHEALL